MSLYNGACAIVRAVLKVFIRLKCTGEENVPQSGAFLLCANHRSNLDPVMIAATCSRELTFMAKEELFKKPVLGAFIKKMGAFPIKRGKGDAAAVMATLKILRRGGATLIFPEGTRIKTGERISVNSGIIRLAIQAGAKIVPVHVTKNTVTYGEAVDYEKYFDDVKNPELMQQLANELMDGIYSLAASSEAEEKK